MVRVFYATIPDRVDESIVPYLSDYRQKRLSMMSNEKARKESIYAELLLEKAVYPQLKRPLPIITGEFGKPYFADNELYFSLSHSGGLVACAVADFEIGFDVQLQKTCDPRLAKRFFAEEEFEYLSCSKDQDKTFNEIWCKKESWIKALGRGMRIPLKSFSVLSNAEYWYATINDYHFALCSSNANQLKVNIVQIKLL